MLELSQWLPLSACCCLMLAPATTRSDRWYLGSVVIMVSLSYGLAGTLADFSVLRIHQWLQPIAGVLAGWLLLESLLLMRWAEHRPWLSLISPGRWLAQIYLQMQFYQSGWLQLEFSMQALVYGLLIALWVSVIWLVVKTQLDSLPDLLVVGQWVLIFVAFAALPKFSSSIGFVLEELAMALLLLGALLGVGYVCGQMKIHSIRDFWRSKL